MNRPETVGRGVCCMHCDSGRGKDGTQQTAPRDYNTTLLTRSTVVSPLPHTRHTVHAPGTHTALSHYPRRQVLHCHSQTCPPTHFHTSIRALCRTMGIHIDAGETHTDTWAHIGSAHVRTCGHMHILCCVCKFSVPPMPRKGGDNSPLLYNILTSEPLEVQERSMKPECPLVWGPWEGREHPSTLHILCWM